MSRIKENPIKYVRLFSMIYLIAFLVLRILYYVISGYPIDAPTLLGLLLSVIPMSLFLVYTYKFYGTKKSQILLPLSYIVSLAINLFSTLVNIRRVHNGVLYFLFGYSGGIIISLLFQLISLGISVFLIYDCFNNFKSLKISKKLVIISAIISILSTFGNTLSSLIFGITIFSVFTVITLLTNLTSLLSYFAYIIFWKFAVDKRNISPLEYDLLSLKQSYEKGEITEEQYTIKRAEILNSL